MMNHECNKQIFYRDLVLWDNNTIACGSHLWLLVMYPIEQMMEGIPLVKSSYPAIAMEIPKNKMAIAIDS